MVKITATLKPTESIRAYPFTKSNLETLSNSDFRATLITRKKERKKNLIYHKLIRPVSECSECWGNNGIIKDALKSSVVRQCPTARPMKDLQIRKMTIIYW